MYIYNTYLRCSHISRSCVFSSPSNPPLVGLSFPPITRQKQPKPKWYDSQVPAFPIRKHWLSFYASFWKQPKEKSNLLIKTLIVSRLMHSTYYLLTACSQTCVFPCSSWWKIEFVEPPVNAHCSPSLQKAVCAFHSRFLAIGKASVGIYLHLYVKNASM